MKLGLKWKNKYFIDGAVVFGWLHGTGAFELCSSAIAKHLQSSGIIMHPYIDDFLYILEAANAESQFEHAEALITALGLPVNYEKISYPSKTVTCRGIHIDLINNTLSIDAEKLISVREHCDSIRSKKYISKRAYQSLLGKLFYIHKCVKPARRMLALFQANSHKQKIRLSEEFFADLDWFIQFLTEFNGITMINKEPLVNQEIHLDACLQGVGAIGHNRCYAAPIPFFIDFRPKIVHLEMVNLLVAVRVWGQFWSKQVVKIHCDNIVIVHVVKAGKTRDKFLAASVRCIWYVCARWDIQLEV